VPMTAALLAAVLSIVPVETTIPDRCDIIETNHLYSEDAKLVFTQNIFIDWCDAIEGERIAAWRLWKNPDFRPQFNYATGLYETRWVEADGVVRVVVAPSVREVWSQQGFEGDRELNARDSWNKERRRELRKAEVTK
jgi:hypothetical protein